MRPLILMFALAVSTTALAQPGDDSAAQLRAASAAATAGDWAQVAARVEPLIARALASADLAEAHRLAGLAAFFQNRRDQAEAHFLAYLAIDLDGRLDPALYPPEVVYFFDDVRARHSAELRARRPKAKRYAVLNLVPPFGQFQNGDRAKAWTITGLLGGFAIGLVTSQLVLRSWCTQVSGPGGASLVCDQTINHDRGASTLRTVEITSGVGLILTYVYGVYDGVAGYRRRSREQSFVPYATPMNDRLGDGVVVGVVGRF